MNKKISQEEGVPMIGEDQLNFSLRLWDLNQDGKVGNARCIWGV